MSTGEQSDLDEQRETTDAQKDVQNLKTELKKFEDNFEERISSLKKSFKAELNYFMAYATISTFCAGVAGAVIGALMTLRLGPVSIDTSTTTTTSPTPTPTPIPVTACPFLTCQPNRTLELSLEAVNKSLSQCMAEHNKSKEHVETLTKNVDNMEKEVKRKYEDLVSNVTLREYIVEAQMSELRNVFVSTDWLFVILLMGLFEAGVIGIVWMMWRKLAEMLREKIRQHSTGKYTSNGVETSGNWKSHVVSSDPVLYQEPEIKGEERILNQVVKVHLQSRVCVVAFHSETIDKHARHVKELLSQNFSTRHVTTSQFLISSHDDILQLPPCKIYLVFVDFNERNVILEDPKKGLGNLRLTAVQVMHLMEAEVVLTYSRDRGSNSLTYSDLYNTDLTSVKQHPELQRLERSRRMLSVFEKFNQRQSDHIVDIVKTFLR